MPNLAKVKLDKMGGGGGGVTAQAQESHVNWVDLVRVIGALMVIGIHYCSPFHAAHPSPVIGAEMEWYVVNTFSVFSQAAVDLFFMISGFLLLNRKSIETKGTIKRILRILFLILGWSIIYLLVRKFFYGVDVLGNPITLYEGIRCILLCKASVNLWFLYALCAVYFVIPILHSFVRNADAHTLRYFVILSFFAITLYRWICAGLCYFFDIKSVYFEFLFVNSIPITYFVAGYYFGYESRFRPFFNHFLGKRGGRIISILGLIALVMIAVFLPIFANWQHVSSKWLFGKFCFIYTVVLFLILKYVGSSQWYNKSPLVKWMKELAPLTLGVYVIHPFAQHLIGDGLLGFRFKIDSLFPAISIPLSLAIIFILAATAAFVMRKIPLVRYLVT